MLAARIRLCRKNALHLSGEPTAMSSGKTTALATPVLAPASDSRNLQVIDFSTLRAPTTSTALQLARTANDVVGDVVVSNVGKVSGEVFMVNPYLVHHMEGWSIRDLSDKDTIATIVNYAHDIAANGVHEPLRVWTEEGKLWVSSGVLRLHAVLWANQHLDANIHAIPVRPGGRHENSADRVAQQIILNNNKTLSALELASGIKALINHGWVSDDICIRLNIPAHRLESIILLSAAEPPIIEMVRSGKVSAAFAMATLKEHPGRPKRALGVLNKECAKASRQGVKKVTGRTVSGPTSISRKLFRAAVIRHTVRPAENGEVEVSLRCNATEWEKIQLLLAADSEPVESAVAA